MNEIDTKNCANCPIVKYNLGLIADMKEAQAVVTAFSAGPALDSVAERIYGGIVGDDTGRAIELDITKEGVASSIRKSAAETLNSKDGQIQEAAADTEALLASCEGPIKMRASKAGHVVTVTVCNSPQAPAVDDSQEHTIVARKKI